MRIDSDKKTQGFEGKLAFDISGQNGNSDKFIAGLGGRAQWYLQDGTHFLVANYEYGEFSGTRDTNKTFLHARNINYITQSQAWETFIQLESNEFTRLEQRSLLGAGFRWQILQSDKHASYFGIGIFRSREELDMESLSDQGISYISRLNNYIVYNFAISSHSRLVNTLYYQPNLSDGSDYRLLEQFALQLDITEMLKFKLSINISHDSEAALLTEETDTSYQSGFEYTF